MLSNFEAKYIINIYVINSKEKREEYKIQIQINSYAR